MIKVRLLDVHTTAGEQIVIQSLYLKSGREDRGQNGATAGLERSSQIVVGHSTGTEHVAVGEVLATSPIGSLLSTIFAPPA